MDRGTFGPGASWCVLAMLVDVWRCTARLVTQPLSWSAWCAFDGAERDQLGLGLIGRGNARSGQAESVMETTLSVSERAAASVAEWDALRPVKSVQVLVRLVTLRYVPSSHGNHHREGTRLDQGGRGGMQSGELR